MLFDDCNSKEEVEAKLNDIRDSGLTSNEVEWSARFKILELESATEILDGNVPVSILSKLNIF